MPAFSHKAKHYGLITLKVLIVLLTFGYVYSRLTTDESLAFTEYLGSLKLNSAVPYLWFITLAAANWCLEIGKWKSAAGVIRPISFKEAAKQSLASLTVSLATPNRIGDYGAKAVYFPAGDRKKILLLNFLSNLYQLSVTLVLGILGLILISRVYTLGVNTANVMIGLGILLLLFVLGFYFKRKEFVLKGLSIEKVLAYFKGLPTNLHLRLWLLSLLRYLVFSYLFLKLLRFFDADIPLSHAYPLIFAMYLFVSALPTIFILDVVVRGGVAVWLFSLEGIPEWPVLCAVLSSWLLNFAIPSIIGSYYLFTYKPPEQ